MTRTIWKYPVGDNKVFTLEMPKRAEILSLQLQSGAPTLWVLVDPSAATTRRKFEFVGTGWEFDPTGLTFIGTFQVEGGQFVFHLFERV